MTLPSMRHLQKGVPLLAFLIALVTYWLTADSGPSYWDCPEYLLTALKLEVGHPPGNPGWTLFHRFASCFFSDVSTQVKVVNMMSGLFTALAVMVLCSLSITIMRLIWPRSGHSRWRSVAICIASLSGSLCFAWSDSAWYSAVEAEVYAMSLFLTSLAIWISLKRTFTLSAAARCRWLVALAYITGFSLGVHQLNLLVLPAIALVMLFGSRRSKKVGFLRVAGAFAAGCVAVVFILKGLMPESVDIALAIDIFAVNTLQLPYWTGALIFWCIAFGIVIVLAILVGKRHRTLCTSLWSLAAVMLGYSVYILIPIRACANPPINEGDPSSISRFADYLSRRQYGQSPLFYGRTPYSQIMRIEKVTVNSTGDTVRDYSRNALKMTGRDWRPIVKNPHIPSRSGFLTDKDRAVNAELVSGKKERGYAIAGFHSQPKYTPELNMLFPRIHASSPDDITAYGEWTGMDTASMTRVIISEAFDSLGNPVARRNADGTVQSKTALRPTYLHSLTYFLGYQAGYMYFRYLLWNYMGRQNDISTTGEIDHGNFITGINSIDGLMLGNVETLPDELSSGNKGRNVYFGIPFLLGIIGIIILFGKKENRIMAMRFHRVAWVSLILFLMTGLAIVVYLNQTPGEPRERDYSFLGSFWVFAFWISCGLLSLMRKARTRTAMAAVIAIAIALPSLMLAQNFDDHDRSGRSATLDYATNLLESLDEDAILFVDGDNYIFPLWFAQEAMGIRRDVVVVCSSYLMCDWYVVELMTPRYGFEGLRMTATPGDIAFGNYNVVRLPSAEADTMPAIKALQKLYSDMSPIAEIPARLLTIGRDTTTWTFDVLGMTGKGARYLAGLRELASIDIVATNAASRYPRPIYWHQNLSKNKYSGFYPHTRQALLTRRLMPSLPDSTVLTDECLDALPKFQWGGIEHMSYPGPDITLQAQQQRASLLRLAESLSNEGRHDLALHVARMALVRFPQKTIPFSIRSHADSVYFERVSATNILLRSGQNVGDSVAVALGQEISRVDSIRQESFSRYYKSLPPSRRHAVSPTSRNLSIKKN